MLDAEEAGQGTAELRLKKKALQQAYDQALRKKMVHIHCFLFKSIHLFYAPSIASPHLASPRLYCRNTMQHLGNSTTHYSSSNRTNLTNNFQPFFHHFHRYHHHHTYYLLSPLCNHHKHCISTLVYRHHQPKLAMINSIIITPRDCLPPPGHHHRDRMSHTMTTTVGCWCKRHGRLSAPSRP